MKYGVWIALAIGLCFSRPTFAVSSYLFRSQPNVWHRSVGQPISGLTDVRRIPANDISQLSLAEFSTVQPERVYHAMFIPNDPQYTLQWYIPTANVPLAWDADTATPLYGGDPSVVVAVLDTGLTSTLLGSAVSMNDFSASSIWTNTGEVAGDGIDNDHDGFIDDVHGWNFVANTNQPADDHLHGTHLASLIAATMNNALGTAGIASNVTIMPLKVLNSSGSGITSQLTGAINYAVAHGADIINLSLGGTEDDPVFHQSIQAAVAAGVVVVAASGNEGASTVDYPGRYDEVVSVGAVQRDLNRSAYANYGTALDLVAPGGSADPNVDGILAETCTTSACTNTSLFYISGTSQAAAQVSAVAALLESCGVAGSSVAGILTSTAHDLGAAGRDDVYGAGLLDANAAIVASGCTSSAPAAPTALWVRAGSTSAKELTSGQAYPYTAPAFEWTMAKAVSARITVTKDGATIANINQASVTYTLPITSEGNYQIIIVTVDAIGRSSAAVSFTYRYQRPTAILSSAAGVQFISSALKVTKTVTSASPGASGGAVTLGQASRLLLSVTKRGSYMSIADTSGKPQVSWKPFGTTFSGDITAGIQHLADGTSQIVAATATGGSSLAWFTTNGTLLGRATVVPNDMNGLSLAIGDVDRDGNDEVIVGQQVGAQILVYNASRVRITKMLPRGKTFRQGWQVGAGDVDGDGHDEIIATPNIVQGVPVMLILNQAGIEKKKITVTGLPKNIRLRLTVQDMTGDGRADILTVPAVTNPLAQLWSGTGQLIKKATLTTKLIRSLSLIR
jgi:serine protease